MLSWSFAESSQENLIIVRFIGILNNFFPVLQLYYLLMTVDINYIFSDTGLVFKWEIQEEACCYNSV